MKYSLTCLLLIASTLVVDAQSAEVPIADLIKGLGSPNFKVRESASNTLRSRPDAAPYLRGLLRSSDPETARRAADILDFLDRAPVRDLHAAAKAGQFDRMVELLANWPKGKYEQDAWSAFCGTALKLAELHTKAKGKPIVLRRTDALPIVVRAERIDHDTPAEIEKGYFLRAGEVSLDRVPPGTPQKNCFANNSVIVATGQVRLFGASTPVVFARGPIHLHGDLRNAVIVGGDDIVLKGTFAHCLIIARGKVTCNGEIAATRIVAGKTVSTERDPEDCIISENDSNPLGFIRWADAPKDKPAPKSK